MSAAEIFVLLFTVTSSTYNGAWHIECVQYIKEEINPINQYTQDEVQTGSGQAATGIIQLMLVMMRISGEVWGVGDTLGGTQRGGPQ